jgi:beta-glucosidase
MVTFIIKEAALRFYDIDIKYVAESGDFTVYVGPNSRCYGS